MLSVLTAGPTRDIVQTALQQLTHEWWERRSRSFDLFISDFVLREASRGDKVAARRRLDAAANLKELSVNVAIETLATRLLNETRMPSKAQQDAAHLACAAVHGMDYLVTWNCTHIANAVLIPQVQAVCLLAGHKCPQICTPQELMVNPA